MSDRQSTILPKYRTLMPRECIASTKPAPSTGVSVCSRQSRIKLGIWWTSRNWAPSDTRRRCLAMSSLFPCSTVSQKQSGLKRMSNSVSLRDPTANAAFLMICFVAASEKSPNFLIKSHWILKPWNVRKTINIICKEQLRSRSGFTTAYVYFLRFVDISWNVVRWVGVGFGGWQGLFNDSFGRLRLDKFISVAARTGIPVAVRCHSVLKLLYLT